jgi:hypothetical protein
VFVYRYDEWIGPASEPNGVLTGANYPHGLRFSADDRHVFVADAGLPFLHVFASVDGDWSGTRQPSHSSRVMSDVQFVRGKYNPQEGGPKGLDLIHEDGVVVITSEHQSLAFFDARQFGCVPGPPQAQHGDRGAARRTVRRISSRLAEQTAELARLRAECEWRAVAMEQHERESLDHAERSRELAERTRQDEQRHRAEISAQRAEISELESSLRDIRASTAWRMTGPVRATLDRIRRLVR